jgi:hypothetical protein
MISPSKPHPLFLQFLKYLPAVEKILLAALCVGIPLMIIGTDTAVVKVSLIGLAITYFLTGYRPIDVPVRDDKPLSFKELFGIIILPKVAWVSCAVLTIGLLFTLLGYEGYHEMLLIGCTSGGVGTFLFTVLWIGGVEHIPLVAPVLLRLVPLFLVDTYFLLTKMNIL